MPEIVSSPMPFDVIGVASMVYPPAQPCSDGPSCDGQPNLSSQVARDHGSLGARRVIKKGAVFTLRKINSMLRRSHRWPWMVWVYAWKRLSRPIRGAGDCCLARFRFSDWNSPAARIKLDLEPVMNDRPWWPPNSMYSASRRWDATPYVLGYWPDLQPIGQVPSQ